MESAGITGIAWLVGVYTYQLHKVVSLSFCQHIVVPVRAQHSPASHTPTQNQVFVDAEVDVSDSRLLAGAHRNARGSHDNISIQNLSFSSLLLSSTNLRQRCPCLAWTHGTYCTEVTCR